MKKLKLTRETLIDLNPAELADVNGGLSPVISISLRLCGHSAKHCAKVVTTIAKTVDQVTNNERKRPTIIGTK